MTMSTMHALVAPAATVNCHCTPVSFMLVDGRGRAADRQRPAVNGTITVVTAVVTVSAACGA